MTRARRVLALCAAAVVPMASAAALAAPRARAADVTPPSGGGRLDVLNLNGSAAGIQVTVRSGYSFVVEPDARVPRAEASIAADTSTATTSPADPGDSVDQLPGLYVPTATGCLIQAADRLPPPYGDTAAQILNPVDPALTYQYEHASVQYPNPAPGQDGLPQTATLGPDVQVSDPSGAVTVDAATGRAFASRGEASARAGAGAAATALPLGLTAGAIASTVTLRGSSTAAVSDAQTTVDDVSLTPPQLPLPPGIGAPLLHIGSLTVSAHAERRAGARTASGATSVEYAGVTFAGEAATLDQTGVHLAGAQPVTLQQLAAAFNQLVSVVPPTPPPAPLPLPVPTAGYQIPAPRLTPPAVSDTVGHGGNEDTASVAGLTFTVASAVPVPTVPGTGPPTGCQPPSPPTGAPSINPTPATVAVTLGAVSARAYGFGFPAASLSLGPLAGGLGSAPVPPAGSGPAVPPAVTATGGAAPAGAGQAARGESGLESLLVSGRLLSRPAVVALAAVLETLLLFSLLASYRAARPRPPEPDPGLDLV